MNGNSSLSFAPDHPAFAGHFPGRPIVPGVLLLDAVIHAIMSGQSHLPAGDAPRACQISSAKFLSPVSPGEPLILSWSDTGKGQIRFDISGPGRQVATGLLAFGHAA